jgi:hypothetical protein
MTTSILGHEEHKDVCDKVLRGGKTLIQCHGGASMSVKRVKSKGLRSVW